VVVDSLPVEGCCTVLVPDFLPQFGQTQQGIVGAAVGGLPGQGLGTAPVPGLLPQPGQMPQGTSVPAVDSLPVEDFCTVPALSRCSARCDRALVSP
jgi:hypothetical protein